jgi:hypothetical protein
MRLPSASLVDTHPWLVRAPSLFTAEPAMCCGEGHGVVAWKLHRKQQQRNWCCPFAGLGNALTGPAARMRSNMQGARPAPPSCQLVCPPSMHQHAPRMHQRAPRMHQRAPRMHQHAPRMHQRAPRMHLLAPHQCMRAQTHTTLQNTPARRAPSGPHQVSQTPMMPLATHVPRHKCWRSRLHGMSRGNPHSSAPKHTAMHPDPYMLRATLWHRRQAVGVGPPGAHTKDQPGSLGTSRALHVALEPDGRLRTDSSPAQLKRAGVVGLRRSDRVTACQQQCRGPGCHDINRGHSTMVTACQGPCVPKRQQKPLLCGQ